MSVNAQGGNINHFVSTPLKVKAKTQYDNLNADMFVIRRFTSKWFYIQFFIFLGGGCFNLHLVP
jgi:hypothetical protein